MSNVAFGMSVYSTYEGFFMIWQLYPTIFKHKIITFTNTEHMRRWASVCTICVNYPSLIIERSRLVNYDFEYDNAWTYVQ